MVVLLVIITFAAFIAIDALVNRKRVPVVPLVATQEAEPVGAGSVDAESCCSGAANHRRGGFGGETDRVAPGHSGSPVEY